MTKVSIIVIFIAALSVDDAAARSWLHRHHRHHQTYDPTFCRDIITAFDQLGTRDLDTFVKSVPDDKRKQALRCLTRIGR